ncbi:extracellular solute-binding protein [Paenibacillus ginsengarvi]|uniref:Extracellular solute-binding protein n=1 Tax=Paenibacillus ginsengarvi TaxID=400777 RepID=A0A3B0BCE8_9BACL|nr:extracellular solute-binding protein [Paenibacillus ginsengarvi]RKN70044.1 extracellular solute-binding protein [Paenibacillus ginsengarvi]
MESRQSRKTFRTRLDELITTLRDEIVTGKRVVGEFLPSEKTYAEQSGLSNQSVRKALEVLVDEGLIVKIPRVGNKVAGPAPGGIISLKFGYHTSIMSQTEIELLLDMFGKKYPHIRVELIPLPTYNHEMVTKYMENEMLDIVTMNNNEYREFAENDRLSTLEPLPHNPQLYPFLAEAFRTDGMQHVIPFVFSPVILCYNRDHFLEHEVPEPDSSWTWDQLIDNASKLAAENERLGFYYNFHSPNRWPLLLLQSGGAFERSDSGGVRIAGTPMADGFRFCREMKNRLPSLWETIGQDQSEKLFVQGKASMMLTSYFHLNILRGSDIPFDIGPVPHFGVPKTLLICIGLAVSRHSRSKEAALKLAEFLTSYEAQLVIRQKTYTLPASKPAAEWVGTEAMYRPPRFMLFRETIPSFHYFTDLNIGQKDLIKIMKEATLYWAGLENEETFISRLEQWNPAGV